MLSFPGEAVAIESQNTFQNEPENNLLLHSLLHSPGSATPRLIFVFPQPLIPLICLHLLPRLNHLPPPAFFSFTHISHSQFTLDFHPLSRRSPRPGLCDSGLPPALLPQHHLRRHRQRCHLRPGGGLAGVSPPSSEEAKRPAAPRCKRELASPPPPSAPAAVPSGHIGPRPHTSRRFRSLPRLPHRSRPVQLHSSSAAAAVWDSVSLRTVHGLTSFILTSCSGCQVKGIMTVTATCVALKLHCGDESCLCKYLLLERMSNNRQQHDQL